MYRIHCATISSVHHFSVVSIYNTHNLCVTCQYLLYTTFVLHANIYCAQFLCHAPISTKVLCSTPIFYVHCKLYTTQHQGFVHSYRMPILPVLHQFYFHTTWIFNAHALHTNIASAPKKFLCTLPILNVHSLSVNIMHGPQALHRAMPNFGVLTYTPLLCLHHQCFTK
jgi:hypothetical protein